MNEPYANFDWNRARAFLATVQEGSLSAAARTLKLTQPTISRQILALERELDVPLFERNGRKMSLTPSGLKLVEELRAMGEAANRVSLRAAGQSKSIVGTARITASLSTAAFLLPTALRKLRELQPSIKIDLLVSTREKSLHLREADIALRHVEPEQSNLIARRIKKEPVRFRMYASPDYLKRLGNPTSRAELKAAAFVNFEDSDRLQRRLNSLGLDLTPENFNVTADDWSVTGELVRQGIGIGLLPEPTGEADPFLERVAVDLPPISEHTWITMHEELKTTPRVRFVYELLCEELC